MCREKIVPLTDNAGRAVGGEAQKPNVLLPTERGIYIQVSTLPTGYANDLPTQPNGLYARVFLEDLPHEVGTSVDTFLNNRVGTSLRQGVPVDGVKKTS